MNLQEIIAEIINHLRGMWRYRWQAIGIAWFAALVGSYMVLTMPNIYQASARVSVDTNSLLPRLTEGLTARENLMSQVDIVSEVLLTRPNLERVARKTDLDLRARDPKQLEALISGLQKRVTIRGGRDNIFRIEYQDSNREKAREVVAELMDSFVESSLGAQGDDVTMTEKALSLEIANHEGRLEKAESDLAEFKKINLGYMPNDGQDYYSRLQTSLASVSETGRQMRLVEQQRNEISRQIEGEEPVFGIMPSGQGGDVGGCSKSGSISQLEAELAALSVNFTDRHPRIVILRDTISALQEECQAEQDSGVGVSRKQAAENSNLEVNPVYQALRLQLSNANVELASLQEQQRSHERTVAQLRADVDKIGEVETEFKRLNRDYGVVSSRHQELLKRWESLRSKQRLDPVTDTVQFNVIEPPFAAAKPVAPNRPMLLIAVSIFALGMGGVVAFALNQLKPVFFTRQSVRRITGLPVLGTVSMIMTPDDISARRFRSIVWVCANVALIAFSILLIAFQGAASSLLSNISLGAGV